jgi:hypothetical protein
MAAAVVVDTAAEAVAATVAAAIADPETNFKTLASTEASLVSDWLPFFHASIAIHHTPTSHTPHRPSRLLKAFRPNK